MYFQIRRLTKIYIGDCRNQEITTAFHGALDPLTSTALVPDLSVTDRLVQGLYRKSAAGHLKLHVKLNSALSYRIVRTSSPSPVVKKSKVVVVSNGTTFLHVYFAEMKQDCASNLQGTIQIIPDTNR